MEGRRRVFKQNNNNKGGDVSSFTINGGRPINNSAIEYWIFNIQWVGLSCFGIYFVFIGTSGES